MITAFSLVALSFCLSVQMLTFIALAGGIIHEDVV